jgi:hypothetical protein
MRSSKGGKAILEESVSKKTATDLYMPNFCWVGAPTTLTFAESKRGKISTTKRKNPDLPAPPERPNPMLEAAAARVKAQASKAPKKPSKQTAISSTSVLKKPKTKATKPPTPTKQK